MDTYAVISQSYFRALDHNVLPWEGRYVRPVGQLGAISPCSGTTGYPYQGANLAATLIDCAVNDRQYPYYLTLRQAEELGGRVPPGCRGTMVTYRKGDHLRHYPVFNIADVEGIGVNDLPAHQKAVDHPCDYLDDADLDQSLAQLDDRLFDPKRTVDPLVERYTKLMAMSQIAHRHGTFIQDDSHQKKKPNEGFWAALKEGRPLWKKRNAGEKPKLSPARSKAIESVRINLTERLPHWALLTAGITAGRWTAEILGKPISLTPNNPTPSASSKPLTR